MRIRKRAVPLPLSLLSPVPLPPSDPRLVQLPAGFQRSDHLPPYQPPASPPPQLKAYEHEKNKDHREEITNPSKEIDSGAVADLDLGLLPLPATPSTHEKVAPVEGRWCDGDKAIPLKKRKASFEMNCVVRGESRMKSKTNKKCLGREDDDDEDDDYSVDDYDDSISSDDNKKKRKTTSKKKGGGAKKKAGAGAGKAKKKGGGGIMEGSRCSRVNGRGWRCMQPTLVGYSLCEHHLGKGRLRSMSSVRAAAAPKPEEKPPCDGGELGLGASKTKRRRIGMVKARSLSSLLCQPNTIATTTTSAIKQA